MSNLENLYQANKGLIEADKYIKEGDDEIERDKAKAHVLHLEALSSCHNALESAENAEDYTKQAEIKAKIV